MQHFDELKPLDTNWIPFSPTCPPSPNYLHLLQDRDGDALSFLRNRTILILGDSVDRNGIEHLAVMLGLPRYSVPYSDFSKKGTVPEGWDERGIPWVVEVPWLDLTFTNGFLYGLVRRPLFLSPFCTLNSQSCILCSSRTTRITLVNNPIGTLLDWPKIESIS